MYETHRKRSNRKTLTYLWTPHSSSGILNKAKSSVTLSGEQEPLPAVTRVDGERGGFATEAWTENTKCRSAVHSDGNVRFIKTACNVFSWLGNNLWFIFLTTHRPWGNSTSGHLNYNSNLCPSILSTIKPQIHKPAAGQWRRCTLQNKNTNFLLKKKNSMFGCLAQIQIYTLSVRSLTRQQRLNGASIRRLVFQYDFVLPVL